MHEKDITASANAIKKIPTNPFLEDFLSNEFAHELGRLISKAPKKEKANTPNKTNIKKLNQILVAKAFNTPEPNSMVIKIPKKT